MENGNLFNISYVFSISSIFSSTFSHITQSCNTCSWKTVGFKLCLFFMSDILSNRVYSFYSIMRASNLKEAIFQNLRQSLKDFIEFWHKYIITTINFHMHATKIGHILSTFVLSHALIKECLNLTLLVSSELKCTFLTFSGWKIRVKFVECSLFMELNVGFTLT